MTIAKPNPTIYKPYIEIVKELLLTVISMLLTESRRKKYKSLRRDRDIDHKLVNTSTCLLGRLHSERKYVYKIWYI